jgi:hypothetical protein
MKWGIGELCGNDEINYYYKNCDSPEIAFIQLLMAQKYNKLWNGEDWIER